MEKTIGKPENWQDFESLCKKLWGEIWEIPDKIKKNGRLGQDQAGVDLYGKPKGENEYWGIQAKSKDDYSQAKLTESEIEEEIEKARKFEPQLAVFIIATSSNKDEKIEKFIRIKDIENREKGSFEIQLFCWEDIVDLIKTYPETHSWYLNGVELRGRFDCDIFFNNLEESLILNPVFKKTIIKHKLTTKTDSELLMGSLNFSDNFLGFYNDSLNPFSSNTINKSWIDFKLVLKNTGSLVIENWKLTIRFKEGVNRLDEGNPMFPKLSKTEFIDNDNKIIIYKPFDKSILVQQDSTYFKISLLPETNTESIIFEWELLASDFNKAGEAVIKIKPDYFEKINYREVNRESELVADEIDISHYCIVDEKGL